MIFYNKYKRVELSSHAYIQNVFIMFLNQTLIYYYSNQLQLNHDFFDFCINIKNAFESSEWQRRNLIKWQIINFLNVVAVNQNASLFECFQKMCLEMNIIQKEFDFVFYDSIHLRKNIIKFCKNHFALINDFNNASINVSNLINVASSDTEAGLRNHVMWLQSRDVTKMTVYRTKQLRLEHLNIYRESLILNKTLSNITMRSIIYTFDRLWIRIV
jgi:hypothetical protein